MSDRVLLADRRLRLTPSFQASSSPTICETTAPAFWTSWGDWSSSAVSQRQIAPRGHRVARL